MSQVRLPRQRRISGLFPRHFMPHYKLDGAVCRPSGPSVSERGKCTARTIWSSWPDKNLL
eukprot:7119676-Pyramimonas_sp.AAC.1